MADIVIAIDGVVGSGKSTTARLVAEALGYRHLDTGAMYRTVALAAGRQGVEPEDERALADLLPTLHIDLLSSDQLTVLSLSLLMRPSEGSEVFR